MAKNDPKIDAYIEKAQPFAQPVLKHLRKLIHTANPDVVEVVKWGMPCFDHKGPYCSMASFKQHAVFGFWKSKLIKDPKGYLGERKNAGGEAMGNFGRITSLKDLPPDKVIIDFLKQAAKLNDEGVKLPAKAKKETKEVVPSAYFTKELKKNKKAVASFAAFSPSKKKEYVEWVDTAKTEETKAKRMATSVEWISEGKNLNWRYETKKKK